MLLIGQRALFGVAKLAAKLAAISRLVAGVICPLATSWDVVTKRPVPTVVFSQVLAHGRLHLKFGRGDWIRTSGLLLPKQLRYRAALRPVAKNGKGRGEGNTPGLSPMADVLLQQLSTGLNGVPHCYRAMGGLFPRLPGADADDH